MTKYDPFSIQHWEGRTIELKDGRVHGIKEGVIYGPKILYDHGHVIRCLFFGGVRLKDTHMARLISGGITREIGIKLHQGADFAAMSLEELMGPNFEWVAKNVQDPKVNGYLALGVITGDPKYGILPNIRVPTSPISRIQ